MLRAIFFNDLGWKLFSLVLAVGIWLTVHKIIDEPKNNAASTAGEPVTFGRTFGSLPVFVVATAADVHLYRVVPKTVAVTVSGSPEAIAGLQTNQLRATVDLTDLDAAKNLERTVEISTPSGHHAGARRAAKSWRGHPAAGKIIS